MKTLFFLIIIGVGLYVGYTIVKKDRILGPRVEQISNEIKVKAGFKIAQTAEEHCAIHFINPKNGETVTTPISVEVVVDNSQENCSWTVFEGQAGVVEIYNESNQVMYKAPLIAQGEWMTADPVTYKSEIEYSGYTGPMKLMITADNPSGEGAPDRTSIMLDAQ